MARFIAKRLIASVFVMIGTLLLVFIVLRAAPGDPIILLVPPDELGGSGPDAQFTRERLRQELGLTRPLYEQFADFVVKFVQLDFGRSIRTNQPIREDLLQRLPNTLELGIVALMISYVIGIPAGIISARRHNTWFDHGSMLVALIGVSMPGFWLGFLLMLLFGLHLHWLPISGRGGPLWELESWRHLILPAVTLGVIPAALVARLMRSGMLDVLRQDYITTARAKGLHERIVVYRHALKNALIPVITILGIQLGGLLSGAFIIESVFAWPGIGRYTVDAISGRDYPVVQATVLITAFAFVLGNLAADILYAYVDPRIRLE
ncbi:MAG: ABC transporter permease [Chloroflexi bacterium]|nr:ABC transporter permease [Chloroflexota bacterium]